jgi:hypothetical protein
MLYSVDFNVGSRIFFVNNAIPDFDVLDVWADGTNSCGVRGLFGFAEKDARSGLFLRGFFDGDNSVG